MTSLQPHVQTDGYHIYAIDDDQVAVTIHEPSTKTPDVPETLVQDIWEHGRFDTSALLTTDGQPLHIFDTGRPNTDSGADFSEAHLQIGEMAWHGDVEIHRTSSDWFAHDHHEDSRYNSVVLHVTLVADAWTGGLLRADGTPLPELVLYPHLTTPLRQLLHQFHTTDTDALPCASQWDVVPETVRTEWIETLADERLMAKAERLGTRYQATPDEDQLLYERLFAGLGYAKNDAPMESLARRVPLEVARSVDSPVDLEALYLGVADLIPAPGDLLDADRATADYATTLRRRFQQWQARLDLSCMNREAWTFFRLRPANFPPLRIAQGAALVYDGVLRTADPVGAFEKALTAPKPAPAARRLLNVRPGTFWNTHLHLKKRTKPRNPQLGTARIDTLLINAVAPLLALRAEHTDRPAARGRIQALLDALPAERDSVTRRFADLGPPPQSASESQALHHLYRTYCTPGRCLSCAIGRAILGRDG